MLEEKDNEGSIGSPKNKWRAVVSREEKKKALVLLCRIAKERGQSLIPRAL